MIAIKVECMEHMPSDCDFCYWFGTRPHPYKGWTDICELMGHCMDDDQPEEWIYSGDGRPKACPLVEIADRKTEPSNSEKPNNSTISKNELVRRLDVVEAVLNLADTIDDVVDVIMSVPTYKVRTSTNVAMGSDGVSVKADRKTENSSEKPNNSTISKMEQVDEPQTDPCDGCVCDDGKHLMYCMNCKGIAWKTEPPKVEDEPQTDCAWK